MTSHENLITQIGGKPVTNNSEVIIVNYENLDRYEGSGFKNYLGEAEYEDLKESVMRIGLQQPIVVRPVPDKDRYVILAGFHRAHAMKDIGKGNQIPAFVLNNISDDEALAIHLDTNGGRAVKTMKPSELIYMVNEKLGLIERFGGSKGYLKSQAEQGEELLQRIENGEKVLPRDVVASEVGFARTAVTWYKRMKNLNKKIIFEMDKGNVAVKAGSALADLSAEDQELVGNILLEKECHVSEHHAKEIVEAARAGELDEKAVLKVFGLLEEEGVESSRDTVPNQVFEEDLREPQQRTAGSGEEGSNGGRNIDEAEKDMEKENAIGDEKPSAENNQNLKITLTYDDLAPLFPALSKGTKKDVKEEILVLLTMAKVELPEVLEEFYDANRFDLILRDAAVAYKISHRKNNP